MKDRGSNLKEVLKRLLGVILIDFLNDRVVPFQTPQARTNLNNVSDGDGQRSQSKMTVLVIHHTDCLLPWSVA